MPTCESCSSEAKKLQPCSTCRRMSCCICSEGQHITYRYVGEKANRTYVVPVAECWPCMIERKGEPAPKSHYESNVD